MTHFARNLAIVLLLIAVYVTAHSQGTPVYTWTDENGVVHFVDTPPGNPDAVEIEVDAAAPSSGDSGYANPEPASDTAAESSEAPQSYADEKRTELAQARQEHAATQAENNQRCQAARARLEELEPSRRVFYTNQDGQTQRLDDVERTGMVADLKNQISEFCQ